MAMSNSKPHLLQLLFISFLLLLLNGVKSQDYFVYDNFFSVSNDNFTFQGDARVSWGTLQLTATDKYDKALANQSLGQVLYAQPVHIWDRSTGRVANFDTSFCFTIRAPPPESGSNLAEGLTFFIAPVGFDIPKNSDGKYLALFNDTTALNPFMNQIVAVEFDTHPNPELSDPPYEHIGIDVNSIQSVATVKWNTSDVLCESYAVAEINYDAACRMLYVTLSYPNSIYRLKHEVDFKSFLPEWVTIGLSAATGSGAETHNILSWHFSPLFKENDTYPHSAHSVV